MGIALTLVRPADAQRRGSGGLRPGSVVPARLLTLDVVKSELKLTDEQKKKAATINERLTQERHKLFSEVPKKSRERGKRVAELDEKTGEELKQLLDESQQKRLREILLQVNGASELLKKDVQESLGIGKEQQHKLSEINHANEKARREALTNFDGDRNAKMVQLQREADKKLLEVLTDKQREQFEKMKGKKITIELFKM
jgi:hypothetical protein